MDVTMSSSESEKEEVQQDVKKTNDSSDSSYEEEVIDDVTTLVELPINVIMERPKPRRKRFIPNYEVEGVHTVMLGEETQILIEMVIGAHITCQLPWKSIEKAKIMESMELYGEASEFFPLKADLEAYDDEFVLMGYIVDESKNVDEFYICCTKEARDHCKQQSDRFIKRQQKKLEKAVYKKARPWKSLGSEKEIMELIPVNTRNLMEIEIRAKFPTTYQPEKFNVRDSTAVRDGYIELTPYRQKFNNVYRRRIDTASQAAPPKKHNHAQTVLKYPRNIWTQSIADSLGKFDDTEAGGDTGKNIEGGGDIKVKDKSSDEDEDDVPKEESDEIALAAYKAAFKCIRRPSYVKMINSFIEENKKEMESIVELNTVMDIYCNDYPNLIKDKNTNAVYNSMTFEEYICFTDVRAKDKYVSSAAFHPMWAGVVAISYSDGSPAVMKTLTSRPDPIGRAVYGLNPVMIWSHIDSLLPKLYMQSPREVKVLSFCPFNENILVGGCINGQIVLWDITNKLENVETIVVLSETREKYRIAMNAHMGWMKSIHDDTVVQVTAASNLMTSHYGPVSSINWLSPNFSVSLTGNVSLLPNKKKSLMFFTGSEDGNIMIWNLSVENITQVEGKKVKKSKRVLKRPSGLLVDVSPYKVLDRVLQPIYRIIIGIAGQPQILPIQSFCMNYPAIKYIFTPKNIGTGRKYFSHEVVPQVESDISNILYCGSQHGEVRRILWEGHEFNTGEVVNSEYSEIKFSCFVHDGIITCTRKNPFINHITLTVGGKVFAVWSDKLLNRPLIWKKRSCRLTNATWSFYKASLLFITTSEGTLETWDLLVKSDLPIAIQTLAGTQLTGVDLHTLPLTKNIIGISDDKGSFRMYLIPPIFMIENSSYTERMENMIQRELEVMKSFLEYQNEWARQNAHVFLEKKRKEAILLAEKEEQKRKQREEEERKLEEEAEARRLAKLRVIGPAERWQRIVQKLIERTIAVKKRINRAELIEDEKPLRELEAQRLEKERRMLEIMKNQKEIFNGTVAILFPEAIKKPPKVVKSYLSDNKEALKYEYLEDYDYLSRTSTTFVRENSYKFEFSWDASVAEGKERRQSLNPYDDYIKYHKMRLELGGPVSLPSAAEPDLHAEHVEEEEVEPEELPLN